MPFLLCYVLCYCKQLVRVEICVIFYDAPPRQIHYFFQDYQAPKCLFKIKISQLMLMLIMQLLLVKTPLFLLLPTPFRKSQDLFKPLKSLIDSLVLTQVLYMLQEVASIFIQTELWSVVGCRLSVAGTPSLGARTSLGDINLDETATLPLDGHFAVEFGMEDEDIPVNLCDIHLGDDEFGKIHEIERSIVAIGAIGAGNYYSLCLLAS